MIGVAVIGYGYWGPNLVRVFGEAGATRVTHVVDVDPSRLALCRGRHPACRTSSDVGSALSSSDVQAVVVATDVASHACIAELALAAGKHVLVEKPFTASVAEAEALIGRARSAGLLLMVDHPFLYTGAVREMKRLVDTGELGDLYYYDSSRLNLGLFQPDVNVLWDLAVHDLAILEHLHPGAPRAVSATGASHLPGQQEDTAYLTLAYDGGFLAHVNVSWIAPSKVRSVTLGGSRHIVVYDDLEPVDKVRVYDRGAHLEVECGDGHRPRVAYRTGEVRVPRLDDKEALLRLAEHFAACVAGREEPLSSAESGLAVVRILEAANASLRAEGRPVALVPIQA